MADSNLRNRKNLEKKGDGVAAVASNGGGGSSSSIGVSQQDLEYETNKSLISRQIAYVVPISFAAFFLIHFTIDTHPTFCRYSEPFAENARRSHLVVSCCFFLAAIHNVGVGIVLQTWRRDEMEHPRGVHAAGSVVNILAGIGTFLSYASMDQRICIDALGVQTYHSQWAEWITTVPLLTYITIAIEDKKSLTKEDIYIIGFMVAALSFGFSINLVSSKWVGALLFSSAFASICTLVSVAVQANNDLKQKAAAISTSSLDDELWSYDRTHMKRMLSILLIFVLPIFPFIYAMGALKIFDRDVLVTSNVIASMCAKLVFVGVLTFDSILVQLSLEKKANNSRRRFLRYVFHEVRVPLNTITMGLSVVEADADKLSESSLEALHMMHGAAGFMGGTLNDVLSMSKIEDGAMRLATAPFLLENLIHGAVFTAKGLADAKACVLEIEYSESEDFSCPPGKLFVNGDIFRLEHVLVNFLSNAVKFSDARTTVSVKVSATLAQGATPELLASKPSIADILSPSGKRAGAGSGTGSAASSSSSARGAAVGSNFDDDDSTVEARRDGFTGIIADVRVLICDKGIGIAHENLKKLFVPFGQIRPHELQQGQGSGLGLVLAKEIVALHGGRIIVDSKEGVGSTFGFTIPFKLSIPPPTSKSDKSDAGGGSVSDKSTLSSGGAGGARSSPVNLGHVPAGVSSPRTSDKITIKNLSTDGTSTTAVLASSRGRKSSIDSTVELLLAGDASATAATAGASSLPSAATSQQTSTKGASTKYDAANAQSSTSTTTSLKAPSSASEANSAAVVVKPPATTEQSNAPATPQLKFLLVDDTLSNRKMLAMLLMKRKITSDMVINGVEAIDAVREKGGQYDMIFMDNTMPVMCGVEATAKIRELGYDKMIVGITGNALDDDVNAFLVAGADGVFAKPFRDDQLTALLNFINGNGTVSTAASKEILKVLTGRSNSNKNK